MKRLKKIFGGGCLAILASVVLSMPVQAATIDLGELTTGDYGLAGVDFFGVVVDSYTFSLAEISDLAVDLVIEPTELYVTALTEDPIPPIDLIAGGFPDFSVTGLAAGDYVLFVIGAFTDGYYGTMSVTAVPLPAAAWLFASALLGMAGIKRRQGTRRSALCAR